MGSKPKRKLSFETEWLRGYAQTYPPGETIFEFRPEILVAQRIWLIDIKYGFRNGTVTFADKLDGPGARWVVETEDCDGLPFEMTLQVETNSYSVEILFVRRLSKENGGENAA